MSWSFVFDSRLLSLQHSGGDFINIQPHFSSQNFNRGSYWKRPEDLMAHRSSTGVLRGTEEYDCLFYGRRKTEKILWFTQFVWLPQET